MYFLLFGIHIIFIAICQVFGYTLLEVAFGLLLVFFLLYFSPIFFSPDKKDTLSMPKLSLDLSPKNSLIIPLILVYTAIYLLVFTFTGSIASSIYIHILIFILIYLVFGGFILAFHWKNQVFIDILRFHLVCSYITILVQVVFFSFFPENIPLIQVLFLLLVTGFSLFFFSVSRDEDIWIFQTFLLSIFASLMVMLIYIFQYPSLSIVFFTLALAAIALFELSPRQTFFAPFLHTTKVFALNIAIVSFLGSGVNVFFDFSSIYSLVILLVFFFSVHVRFSNYVAYVLAIAGVFFVYAFLFFGLLHDGSLLSTLSFIFFFPLCIIGNTYFWEEKHPNDFAILHYSSIGFSVAFFLYSAIFVGWGSELLVFLSFSALLLALLFFLSYFRYRT